MGAAKKTAAQKTSTAAQATNRSGAQGAAEATFPRKEDRGRRPI
jgi:hypothetical protein